jgi:hypothetical protein
LRWRQAAGICDGPPVEEIAGIERGVAHELENDAVYLIRAGFRDDVGKARGAPAELGRHNAGIGANFLDGIDIEIGERRPAQFRVRRIGAVHGEHGSSATLAIHRELLGEVGGAVGVGLRSGSEQQQLAEIALVERQSGNSAAGKALAAGGRGIYALHLAMEHQLVLVRQIQRHFGVFTRLNHKRRRGTLSAFFPAHGNRVAAGGQAGEAKFPLCIRGDGSQFAATLKHDGSSVDRMAGGVAQNALP